MSWGGISRYASPRHAVMTWGDDAIMTWGGEATEPGSVAHSFKPVYGGTWI